MTDTDRYPSFINRSIINKPVFYAIKLAALSGILMLTIMPVARAATVDVTTEFIADLSQPQKNEFVNTTPVTGFCVEQPNYCNKEDFSILIPGLTSDKYFDYASTDIVKNHTSISLDGTIKNVMLTDVKTGNTIEGKFRLAFFGMQHNRLDANSGHLFNAMYGTGLYPSGGCKGRIGVGSPQAYAHGWGVPEAKLTCYHKLSNNNDSKFQGNVHIDKFSFGYNLTTPNPLNVYSGEYEGEVVYTVGEGGDINFNAETTSDSEIRIKIKATVRHAFKLFLAPGSENVSLAPKGGWNQWVNGGRVPDSLNKEVPFTLSSTSGFTVNMRCGNYLDEGCALLDSSGGEKVPLEVALTLPGFKTESGSEVRNLLLNSLPAGRVILPPGQFVVDRRSQVDFRVRKPGVETMMKSPGSTWRGNVTLVFDIQTD